MDNGFVARGLMPVEFEHLMLKDEDWALGYDHMPQDWHAYRQVDFGFRNKCCV